MPLQRTMFAKRHGVDPEHFGSSVFFQLQLHDSVFVLAGGHGGAQIIFLVVVELCAGR